MSNHQTSSIEDLNHALLSHNPFNEVTVTYQNIWQQEFPDVAFLNAHASDAVFQTLQQNYKTSIVITAEYGTGKSHIISRIRHCLKSQGGALFVYANKYGDLKNIKQGFQKTIADSLNQQGSQDVRQWQELATDMANEVLTVRKIKKYQAKDLVNKFTNSEFKKVRSWVIEFTKSFCKLKSSSHPNINPDIIQALFWTLSSEEVLYANNWLGGQELAYHKTVELGLPPQNLSFDAVVQILDLISEYNQLVICFDELDNLVDQDPDLGYVRAQFVAGLIKELFENLKRGIILSVMLPNVWQDKIKKTSSLSWHKVSDYGEPIRLKFIDENAAIELVKMRLSSFYASKNLVPHNPLYPLDENEIRKLGKNKSQTVREVLNWCKKNLLNKISPVSVTTENSIVHGKEVTIESLGEDPVKQAFDDEMKQDVESSIDDNYLIADALLFGCKSLIGKTIEGIFVEGVTEQVRRLKRKESKDSFLNFKIIGKQGEKDIAIGVAVLQYDGGHALGAGFKRLIAPQDYSIEITRGCLVRSKTKKITGYMDATYLKPLISQGGEYVKLEEEEIKPLIAIRAVHQKRSVDYQLTEEEILKFIHEKGAKHNLGESNPLLREILSDPSYQVPDDVSMEEPVTLSSELENNEYESENDIDLSGF
ncbi:MAG: P-loop NTPase fold protein [Planktothrix sp.]|uniref:P-loop NTPase fold protein n=1 Tax=Planktothrix sp. TaxID=3088171 RepID=UPI0038D4C16F